MINQNSLEKKVKLNTMKINFKNQYLRHMFLRDIEHQSEHMTLPLVIFFYNKNILIITFLVIEGFIKAIRNNLPKIKYSDTQNVFQIESFQVTVSVV